MALAGNVARKNAGILRSDERSRPRVVGDHYTDSGWQCTSKACIENRLKGSPLVRCEYANVHAFRKASERSSLRMRITGKTALSEHSNGLFDNGGGFSQHSRSVSRVVEEGDLRNEVDQPR